MNFSAITEVVQKKNRKMKRKQYLSYLSDPEKVDAVIKIGLTKVLSEYSLEWIHQIFANPVSDYNMDYS